MVCYSIPFGFYYNFWAIKFYLARFSILYDFLEIKSCFIRLPILIFFVIDIAISSFYAWSARQGQRKSLHVPAPAH